MGMMVVLIETVATGIVLLMRRLTTWPIAVFHMISVY